MKIFIGATVILMIGILWTLNWNNNDTNETITFWDKKQEKIRTSNMAKTLVAKTLLGLIDGSNYLQFSRVQEQ